MFTPFVNQLINYKTKLPVTSQYLATALSNIAQAKSVAYLYSLQQDYQNSLSTGAILPAEADSMANVLMAQNIPAMNAEMNGDTDPTINDPIKTILDDCNTYLQQVNQRTSGSTDYGSGG